MFNSKLLVYQRVNKCWIYTIMLDNVGKTIIMLKHWILHCLKYNVGRTIIMHPPNHHFYRGLTTLLRFNKFFWKLSDFIHVYSIFQECTKTWFVGVQHHHCVWLLVWNGFFEIISHILRDYKYTKNICINIFTFGTTQENAEKHRVNWVNPKTIIQ